MKVRCFGEAIRPAFPPGKFGACPEPSPAYPHFLAIRGHFAPAQDKKSCRSPKEASRNAGTVAGRHVLGDQFVENVVVKRDTFAGAGAFDVLDEIDPIIIKGAKIRSPRLLLTVYKSRGTLL